MTVKFGNGIDLQNQRGVGFASPTSGTDAANKNYVDAVAKGIDWKDPVRVATTTAGTLASSFANGQTVDGVTLATGDRILIKDQATGSENGLYTVNASGAPTRAVDADENAEVTQGLTVAVLAGTVNGPQSGVYKAFILTTANPITLGTTALTFGPLGGGSGTSYTAGNGLTLTSTTFDVVAGATPGSGGPGGGLKANADDIVIDTNIVVRKFAANIGDGSTTAITVTHNLGTRDVMIAVYDNTTFEQIMTDNVRTTTNTATVTFASAPASNAYRIVIFA